MDKKSTKYEGIEGLHIYKNSTGVLVLLDELSVLCDNREVLDKAISEGYLTEVTRKDIMYKKNPFGKNFPSKAPELVNSLLQELAIDPKSDLDAGLLETVEARIRNLQKPYTSIAVIL